MTIQDLEAQGMKLTPQTSTPSNIPSSTPKLTIQDLQNKGMILTPKTSDITQQPQQKSVGGFFGNILGSAAQLGGGVIKTLINPFTPAKNLLKIGAGAVETIGAGITGKNPKQIAQEQPSSPIATFGQFADYLKNRYGGLEQLKNTIYNDPVGFLLDLSVVSGGANTLLKGTELEKLANISGKISETTDPFRMGIKATQKIGKITGKGSEFLLGLTTRRGPASISEAYEAGKTGGEAQQAFLSGMRGGSTEAEVVGGARDALSNIEAQRSGEYNSELTKIKQVNPQSLDITPITTKQNELFQRFNVKINPDGSLDLSRSPLLAYDKKVQAINDLLKDYGSKTGDRTVVGLDILKRNLRDFRGNSSDTVLNSFVDQLSGSVGNLLKKEIPGYSKLMTDYGTKSELIQSIQKDLSLGEKTSVDRAFRNLVTAVKKDNELKTGLMKSLEQSGSPNLIKKLAGMNMAEELPDDIFRAAIDIGVIYRGLFGMGNPMEILSVLATSPRAVGEFVNALGVGSKYSNKIVQVLQKFKVLGGAEALIKGGYVTGQTRQTNQEGQLFPLTKTTTPSNLPQQY